MSTAFVAWFAGAKGPVSLRRGHLQAGTEPETRLFEVELALRVWNGLVPPKNDGWNFMTGSWCSDIWERGPTAVANRLFLVRGRTLPMEKR
ncbi:hypothetical protein [Deinococcus navajonensis]|uniref:Uncharacterized protein n=1 Tax=Deinococcus navajonensis TaxID=309884 RepID=A0ABV8XNL4_9DEIO